MTTPTKIYAAQTFAEQTFTVGQTVEIYIAGEFECIATIEYFYQEPGEGGEMCAWLKGEGFVADAGLDQLRSAA